MAETIITYKIDKPKDALPMDRGEFYSQQIELSKKGQDPDTAVDIVDILIFD